MNHVAAAARGPGEPTMVVLLSQPARQDHVRDQEAPFAVLGETGAHESSQRSSKIGAVEERATPARRDNVVFSAQQ